MAFSFNTTPGIRCGRSLAATLGGIAGPLVRNRVLFITDKGLTGIGLPAPALASLKEAGIEVQVFDAVEADPSLATLMAATDRAVDFKATGIIGFGGGSSMDVAKLVALLAGSGEDIDEAWGVGNAKGPRLPLVLVPTTAGTGSEVTPVSIITVDDDEKRGVSSPVILPDLAVLDAELTMGLPQATTAATGIDAMVHAIEAFTSINANNNAMSRMLAREALTLLGANIRAACAPEADFTTRENMLIGSMLAGMAFANSPVAAVHALAYPIGGTFHIPHGLSNALILAEVMRFNMPVCHREYAELAPLVFPDIAMTPSQTVAAEFITRLKNLSGEIGLPPRLRDVDIGEDHLPQMAAAAMKQTRLLVNNPREVTQADALSIYRAAW